MSKVFRLYNIQSNPNITDWQESVVYGTQAINEITDPDGADAKKEITSIPSPFARIDLVKTAFREVVNMANRNPKERGYMGLDGNTIYHKMVSDALDIAQIFFNIETFKDKFEIIVWDRKNDLDTKNVFGKTLKRYFDSDSTGDDPYNFRKLERIYLLNYIGPGRPSALNIVGATSPSTLFFSSANNLDYVAEHINFGQDRPFDHAFQPLHKRDFEFQKYLYAFRQSYGVREFQKDFPEIEDYLISSTGKICTYSFLDQEQKNVIDRLDSSTASQYDPISIGHNSADQLEILGHHYHKKSNITNWKSDFEIDSDLYKEDKKPLVLPVESGNTYSNLTFTTDKWGKDYKAGYYDNRQLSDRQLPVVSDKYPYLTISDFLSDTIVRMPYDINKESFFDGNIDRADGKSYLLPLTDLFFQFFTADQVRGTLKDGKKMFELKNNAGGITVVLRIPIKNNKHIEYRRTYFEFIQPNLDTNDGGLIEIEHIDCALFPNIKFKNAEKSIYRFGFVSNFNEGFNFNADFKLSGSLIQNANKRISVRNESRNSNFQCKNYSLEGTNFDYIQLSYKDLESVIIPIFTQQQADDQEFTFAIDFGTTNTHIEYRVGNSRNINVFDIVEADKQIHWLHGNNELMTNVFDAEYIPLRTDGEFHFPTRTALSYGDNTNWGSIEAYEKAGFATLYEKRLDYKYHKTLTNLKWSDDENIQNQVSCYVESLFLILRNKVILNSGNLSETKIKWFFPVSMEKTRYENLVKSWEKAYLKYFGEELSNITPITESVAPYEYYKGDGNAVNIVTVDIGGGTTDIVVAQENKVDCISSFKFAANSLFGDGYAENNRIKNGMIRQFRDNIREALKKEINENDEIFVLFDQMYDDKSSEDVASFLFSLRNNKKVCSKGTKFCDSVDFSNKLRNDNTQKITFILFYTAIIYHLAKIMKAKNLKMPEKIVFSGNGSRVIQLLTEDEAVLARFTKQIFEKVYLANYPSDDLILILNKNNPKEATCKGGFFIEKPDKISDILRIKKVLNSNDNATLVEESHTYGKIDDNYLSQTIEETKHFMDFVFDMLPFFSKEGYKLNATSIDIAKQICYKGLEIYLKHGVNKKMKEVSRDEIIEETLFFYPLVGVINSLADAICSKNLSNTK